MRQADVRDAQAARPRAHTSSPRSPSARRLLTAAVLLLSVLAWRPANSGAVSVGSGAEPAPGRPETRREDVVETIHGTKVSDPYRWLERGADPEVQRWMREQDQLSRRQIEQLPERDALRERFHQLLYVDAISPPSRHGTGWFYTRTPPDKEKAIVYRREGERGAETVVLDPNTLSADGSVSLRGWWPSADGRYLAYKTSKNNADSATLRIRDLGTGKDLDRDVIDDAKYAAPAWTPDGTGFYYSWLPTDPSIPTDERPGRTEIRFHPLGGDPASDTVTHPATRDPTTFLGVDLSHDGRWLFVYVSHGWSRTDIWFRDLSVPASPAPSGSASERAGFRSLVTDRDAVYYVSAWKGSFYVTTSEGAPRYHVFRVDPARPARDAWQELIPEAKDATLEDVRIAGDRLVLLYLRNAVSELELRNLDGRGAQSVQLPPLGSVESLEGQPDDGHIYFGFESFTQFPQIMRTDVATAQTVVWESTRYPVDVSQMTAQQVWYRSKDGTPVSMFLVHRKELPRDGSNKVLLTGYGGFALNQTPWFSTAAAVWVERGGVFALPNLRGGGEYGEEWHRAGMLERKQNVFDDFAAAAEYLIREGFTRPQRLGIRGGSNGGLLVGAAMTQHPELFGAVVCEVPLLDMVRYHLFGSGRTWVEEYGSSEDPEQFKALYAYSPYHHVSKGTRYPPLLVLSADSDDRVDPMHARKFVAAMQWATPPDLPVWLRIEANAGHGGADLRKQEVDRQADKTAFLLKQLQ